MAGFGKAFAEKMLRLFLHGTAITGFADNAASSPITTLYLALHSADPTNGTQSTDEATYPGYVRLSVTRDSSLSDFEITLNQAVLKAARQFGTSTGTPDEELPYWSLGEASSGAGMILFVGEVFEPFTVTAADLIPELDDTTMIEAT